MFRPTAIAAVLMLWHLSVTTATADAIDEFVTAELNSKKIPGIALLVMKDGAVVKQKGYGYANLELQVPVTADTLFQSGSLGKQFTAASVLLLAEDGKLSLEERLASYYPDAPAAWHKITIRQLLSHTSGIRDYGTNDFDYRKDYTDDELLAVMQKMPLDFEPGTQWSYSNSGYIVLGLLVTKIAGKHWSEFQSERLFKPLGMLTTRVISDRDVIPNRAAGYHLDDRKVLLNQDWVAPTFNRTADGALYFSVRDLAEWERALEKGVFMTRESLSQWWTATELSDGGRYPHGFGWFLSEQRGQPVIEHSGAWQGFVTAIWRYPTQNIAVAVLTNADHANPSAIARTVAGLVEPSLAMRAPSSRSAKAPSPDVDTLTRVLRAWGNFGVDPAMSAALAATATGSAREAHVRKNTADKLRSSKALRVVGTDQLTKEAVDNLGDGSVSAVDAILDTADGPVPVRFRLDAKGRVVSIIVDG